MSPKTPKIRNLDPSHWFHTLTTLEKETESAWEPP